MENKKKKHYYFPGTNSYEEYEKDHPYYFPDSYFYPEVTEKYAEKEAEEWKGEIL